MNYETPNNLKNKIFNVTNGTNNGGKMFYLTKVNFTHGDDEGLDDILFAEYFGSVAPKGNKVVMRDSTGHVKSAPSAAQNDCIVKSEMQNIFDMFFPKGFIYVQYPQQKSPNALYNGNGITSTWEEIDYSGAFFRSSGGNAASFIEEGNVLTLQANQNKEHNHGTWTSDVYNSSGTRVNNTGAMSGNSTGWFICATAEDRKSAGGNVSGAAYTSSNYNIGASGGSVPHEKYTVTVSHTHNMQHIHKITADGGNESRPDNYTYKVWKRVN